MCLRAGKSGPDVATVATQMPCCAGRPDGRVREYGTANGHRRRRPLRAAEGGGCGDSGVDVAVPFVMVGGIGQGDPLRSRGNSGRGERRKTPGTHRHRQRKALRPRGCFGHEVPERAQNERAIPDLHPEQLSSRTCFFLPSGRLPPPNGHRNVHTEARGVDSFDGR